MFILSITPRLSMGGLAENRTDVLVFASSAAQCLKSEFLLCEESSTAV